MPGGIVTLLEILGVNQIMDNRGSKSVVKYYYTIVKEQRVNGYRYIQYPPLGEFTLIIFFSSGVDICSIFKMYSNELRNKLWLNCCIRKFTTIHH